MNKFNFEPVAYVDEDDNNKWATLVDDIDIKLNAPLYTAGQLTEAYEAGKRDAIPEGWVLVPKEPNDKMVEAANTLAQGTGRWISIYKAMIAAAQKGEE